MIFILVGLLFLLAIASAILVKKLNEKEVEIATLKIELQHEKERFEENKRHLLETFQSVSLQALEQNNRSFLELATVKLDKYHEMAKSDLQEKNSAISELVKPLKESLEKTDRTQREIKEQMATVQASLSEQVKALLSTQGKLQTETHNLSKALRAPQVRGRWGEMQLKRVVEIAGMVNYCDFIEQVTISSDDKRMRPDMVVKLPGGSEIVIDAKAPLQSYLEAIECENEEMKKSKLQEHARHVRNHITTLATKTYWEQFEKSPDFVVLFLPGETFFSAALEADPSLIEWGANSKVVLATPTTLIALLRTVAYGWKQEIFAKNTDEIAVLGKELYARLQNFLKNFSQLRKELLSSVQIYNQTVGTLEGRVLVTARKLAEKSGQPVDELEKCLEIDELIRS